MTDLFLSYKAEDRPRVEPLVEALEADGLSLWWDADIGGGDKWRDTILKRLEAARGVIVAWSRRSVGPNGHFVRDEATRALKRGTYFPIRIDKVDPPLGFGETQALDLCGWKGDRDDPRYQALLSGLRARLGISTAQRRRFKPTESGISRRTIIAGGAVATVAAAGSGGWLLTRSADAKADSIAVLPFANLSGDPGQAYFSDGIAEELRSALSRVGGLAVVARTSSEAVRNVDAKTAAQKLGVGNILTGSVRRSSSLMRIGVQLIDGNRGVERWSEIYDRAPGDALQIQTDIAVRVAEALSIELGEQGRRALVEGGTRIAAAQDLLFKARDITAGDESEAGYQRALGVVDSAIALDPKYANAVAAKALILAGIAGQMEESAAKGRAMLGEAERLARHAIDIAPRSAQAHGALGRVLHTQLRIRPALAEFAMMAALPGGEARSDFIGVDVYAWVLGQTRQFQAATARAREMVANDPLNPIAFHTMGIVLGQARRYAEANKFLSRAIAMAPDLEWPRAFRAKFLMLSGNLDQAAAEFALLRGQAVWWMPWKAAVEERRGNRAGSNRVLAEMRRIGGDAAHYQYAQVHVEQGRNDEAIAELESAWAVRDPGLAEMNVDQLLDSIRNDPRLMAIEKRLDFPV